MIVEELEEWKRRYQKLEQKYAEAQGSEEVIRQLRYDYCISMLEYF